MRKENERQYIEEVIGNKYQEWEEGNEIFITAPTGAGKSFFILEVLLPMVIDKKVKMLYLVNRRILEIQIEKEIRKKCYKKGMTFDQARQYIEVVTYQSIEQGVLNGQTKDYECNWKNVKYIIYDECHYFYADSQFNTYTELSFDFLKRIFDNKIQIFMSATMDNMQEIIKKRCPVYLYGENRNRGFGDQKIFNNKQFEYSIEKKYDYVDLFVFHDVEDLPQIIVDNVQNDSEKWLIFTDSIEKGKKLCKVLLEEFTNDENEIGSSFSKDDVIFLDADYSKDDEAVQAVNELAERQIVSKKIIVTTPVMDNGISFHDKELRNIVILADTEEIFIQMLGRKRQDGGRVKVYVCQRSALHFQRRYMNYKNTLEFYEKYSQDFQRIHAGNITGFNRRYYNINIDHRYQQKILSGILKSEIAYRSAKKLCYFTNGIISVNQFALKRCIDLRNYYKDMAERMQEDEFAFVKKQVEWLGLDYDKINESILQSKEETRQRYKQTIESNIKELMECEKFDSGMNQKYLKENCEKEILYFLKGDDANIIRLRKEVKKKTRDLHADPRPLSVKNFNFLMEILELDYMMKKIGKDFQIIPLNKAEKKEL